MYSLKTQNRVAYVAYACLCLGTLGFMMWVEYGMASFTLVPLGICFSLFGWTEFGTVWLKRSTYWSLWKTALLASGLTVGILGTILHFVPAVKQDALWGMGLGSGTYLVIILYIQCSSMLLDWLVPKISRLRGTICLASI